MTGDRSLSTVREAVGVFGSEKELENAIDALLESGFDRADISLLASEAAVEEKLGHVYRKPQELEDEPKTPRAAYVTRESLGAAEGALFSIPIYVAGITAAGIAAAAGGPVSVLLAAAALGGGSAAVIGGILASLVGAHHAEYIEQQLDHGGLLLWVRTWNPEQEETAKSILTKFSGSDVHLHQLTGNFETSGPAFQSPEAVLAAPNLTRDQKIGLLQRFEYDAREIEVAAEEGMGVRSSDLFERVLKAMHELGTGPDITHTPPTKQGGV